MGELGVGNARGHHLPHPIPTPYTTNVGLLSNEIKISPTQQLITKQKTFLLSASYVLFIKRERERERGGGGGVLNIG